MKKLCFAALVLLLVFPGLSQSDGTDVSINIEKKCSSTVYDFRFSSTNITDEEGNPLLGTGGTGYFTYLPVNLGEMSFMEENISIYEINESTGFRKRKMNLSTQNVSRPYTAPESYLMNSTNFEADSDVSRLLGNQSVYRAPYWYIKPFEDWGDSRPPAQAKLLEFVATPNFTQGLYQSEMELAYSCEFKPSVDSMIRDVQSGESFPLSEYEPSNYNSSQVVSSLLVDSLNVSVIDKADRYARTVEKTRTQLFEFRIVTVSGEGATPNDIADTDDVVGRELETDADEVDNLSKNASLDSDVEEQRNSSSNVDTDVEEQLSDATPVEGDSAEPGQTPVPEPQPQPQPEPTPLLSLDMKPAQSLYTGPREQFNQVNFTLNNTGEESISNLEISPRFSDGMDWEAQVGEVGGLEVGESVQASVFVNPGEEVEPGIYQIPVYASNDENDIASQYINVEVTEQIARTELSIQEAPQDIRFEAGKNYTLPVLLENAGQENLENVQIELQNTENCGEYTAEAVEELVANETVPVSIKFQASDSLGECEATLVASSDSGSFAFSELTVENVEEKGVVPKEFRVPLIASIWTALLLGYTLVFKRRGLNSGLYKLPLVLLVVGEAFILIYLSSAYYSFIPAELLPFGQG